jgi:hypothetical protein
VETLQQDKQDPDQIILSLSSGQVQQVSWDLTSISDFNSFDPSEQEMKRFVLDSFKYSTEEMGFVQARLDGQVSITSTSTTKPKQTLWSTKVLSFT